MSRVTKRRRINSLQLNGLEAAVWECHHAFTESDRPDEIELVFSVQRMDTDDPDKAFKFGSEQLQSVLRLIHWAEAQMAALDKDLSSSA